MSEIRFYNYEHVPICVETEIISLYETVYYNKTGIFEAQINPYSKAFFRIVNEPYVLAEEGGRLWVITAKQADKTCMLYGRSPNWFFSKKIVEPFTSKRLFEAGYLADKSAETIVRYLVNKYAGGDNGDFVLGEKMGFTYEPDFRRLVLNPLSEVISDCLDTCGGGHEILYDKASGRWVFNILKGKELDIIIGEAQKNVISSEYVENALNFANCGVYEKSFEDMGEWDAENNTPELSEYSAESYGKRYYVSNSGTQFGISFEKGEYAVYPTVDGRIDVSDTDRGYFCTVTTDENASGNYKWFAALEAKTEESAKLELLKNKWEKSIEAQTRGLKLGVDYSLGDIVRVQKKIGDSYQTSKKRIIGTEIRTENGVRIEKIIFGEV